MECNDRKRYAKDLARAIAQQRVLQETRKREEINENKCLITNESGTIQQQQRWQQVSLSSSPQELLIFKKRKAAAILQLVQAKKRHVLLRHKQNSPSLSPLPSCLAERSRNDAPFEEDKKTNNESLAPITALRKIAPILTIFNIESSGPTGMIRWPEQLPSSRIASEDEGVRDDEEETSDNDDTVVLNPVMPSGEMPSTPIIQASRQKSESMQRNLQLLRRKLELKLKTKELESKRQKNITTDNITATKNNGGDDDDDEYEEFSSFTSSDRTESTRKHQSLPMALNSERLIYGDVAPIIAPKLESLSDNSIKQIIKATEAASPSQATYPLNDCVCLKKQGADVHSMLSTTTQKIDVIKMPVFQSFRKQSSSIHQIIQLLKRKLELKIKTKELVAKQQKARIDSPEWERSAHGKYAVPHTIVTATSKQSLIEVFGADSMQQQCDSVTVLIVSKKQSRPIIEALKKRQQELQNEMECNNLYRMIFKQEQLLKEQQTKLEQTAMAYKEYSLEVQKQEAHLKESETTINELTNRQHVIGRMVISATAKLMDARRRLDGGLCQTEEQVA